MEPIVDHLQITVKDFDEAEKFYDQLMPILGFDLEKKGKGYLEQYEFNVIEYFHPNIVIGINSPRSAYKDEDVQRRRPGSVHHLAFRAKNEAEVDEAYEKIKNIGANIVAPPQLYPQHGAHYYALFFKDPGGIKLEVTYEKHI